MSDYQYYRTDSKGDSGRQIYNLYKVLLSRRIKTPSVLKASVHISDCAGSKAARKFQMTRQSFKRTTLPTIYKICIILPFEISRYTSFPSLINIYINGKQGKKNVELISEITAVLRSLNKQENPLNADNESNKFTNERVVPDGKLDKCVPTSYQGCFSVPWEVFLKVPMIAGCVIVAADRICGKGYSYPMGYYFEGRTWTLHELQQEGEFNFVSKNLE
jgi:hypothetical protein